MAGLSRRQILILIILRRRQHRANNKNRKRFWVREIYKRRKQLGEFHTLVREAMFFDHEYFFRMFRMTPTKFEQLLQLVAPSITRVNAKREPIGPDERLCVTLRFLVTGDAFATIAASYRMSTTTVGRVVKDTCAALWNVLKSNGFLNVPQTRIEWLQIAEQFKLKWNFDHCVGAIDGKHVIIQCPPRGGSMYFNYKKFHSIVLMAVVNASYEFIMVDVGDYGRLSDGSVYSSSKLGYAMNNNLLNIPKESMIPGTNKYFPYMFVGDDAFPLKTYLMKPYPRGAIRLREKIANYRISRARRIVENAFGIATSRFRVFRRAITANVESAVEITKAVIAVHNYLMYGRCSESFNNYCPPEFVDQETEDHLVRQGGWRNEQDNSNSGLQNVNNMSSNNYSRDAKQVRDDFRDYFNSETGSVPWQLSMVTSTSNRFDET